MMKINKKRAGALLALTAMAATVGFTAGKAMASDEHIVESNKMIEQRVEKESLGEFVITAYCPCEKCCGEYSDGITATGTVAT